MGHLGFSYVGFIFLLMLTIPNLIWTKHRPKGYSSRQESPVLLVFEKAGQVCVTCTALIFTDLNLNGWSLWDFWLAAAAALMILYEFWWVRYFRSHQTLKDFYSGFWGVPVAGATLPVTAFLFLGIYGKVVWLILSAVVLGIGHIGIHLQHRKEIQP
ncbi:hypothetical protein EQM14_02090 [Caproiciproducens sp. NJN-50]|uniref:hypothetical protein n=1 Tax=Acutalibacteraceae TaxID=3082771 RepID=UPI000FFE0E01|nr:MULTISPECIES: hypothetical protein [Acutalibacteraceae]QAT48668.1 hypothetical protein EQM14_02090 [Caproiciproducens sp. NJN-50]